MDIPLGQKKPRNFGKKRMTFLKEYAQSHGCSLYNALKENLEHELIVSTKAADFVNLIETYAKLYKEMLQQYNNSMRLLLRIAGDLGESEEISPLRKWVKERGK